jgi:dihydrofolate reductase
MKVILLMAMTLDGRIGRDSQHFPDWTGKEDKRLFVEISRRAGVIVMGSKTYDTLDAPLPGRKNIVMTRRQRHSTDHNLVYTAQRPREIVASLEKEGYQEVVLAGGAQINSLFAADQMIDEIILTISPLVFGCGPSLFSTEIALDLELLEMRQLSPQLVMLHYRVLK